MAEMTYVPKGGMCASCVKKNEDCSDLPFETMPVIEHHGAIKVVACLQRVSDKQWTRDS